MCNIPIDAIVSLLGKDTKYLAYMETQLKSLQQLREDMEKLLLETRKVVKGAQNGEVWWEPVE